MSQLVTIAGVVSGVRVDSSITVNTSVSVNQGTSYANSSSSSTETVKKETTIFRVDNKPARFPMAINITNGDIATAAGLQKGEFEVVAIKNHTTNTMYWVRKPSIVPEIVSMVIGWCFHGYHGLGWILVIGGACFLVSKSRRINLVKNACDIVRKAQPPSV